MTDNMLIHEPTQDIDLEESQAQMVRGARRQDCIHTLHIVDSYTGWGNFFEDIGRVRSEIDNLLREQDTTTVILLQRALFSFSSLYLIQFSPPLPRSPWKEQKSTLFPHGSLDYKNQWCIVHTLLSQRYFLRGQSDKSMQEARNDKEKKECNIRRYDNKAMWLPSWKHFQR